VSIIGLEDRLNFSTKIVPGIDLFTSPSVDLSFIVASPGSGSAYLYKTCIAAGAGEY
jgi:hypothetical protein